MESSLVYLLILTVTIHSTNSLFVCPSPCTCMNDPEEADKPGRPSLVVDCRKQSLTTLPPFDGLYGTPIFRLYLDRNQITNIPEQAFRNLTLAGLQLSDNPLVNISAEAFVGTSGIQYLSLRRTALITPPHVFSAPLESLQALDLSEIKTPTFSEIKSGAFGDLANLGQLMLQQNKITSIMQDAFVGLPALFELRLQANKLEQVPEAVLGVPSLVILQLDGNPIANVPSGAFKTLVKLETLTMTDSGLPSSAGLDAGAFEGISDNLRSLDLGTNNLGTVPCDLLKTVPNLRELELRDAMLTEVAPGCFSELTKLHLLDISGNSIQLEADLLAGIEDSMEVLRLERLDLTLEKLPLESLRKMHSLKELSLSGNNFPSLPDRTFDGLAMRKLSLSYCRVEFISPTAFEGLKAPFTLDLNNNKVKNLTFLDNKCQFERIELHRNPVHCDCSFYHVVRYGITTFIGECASPVAYLGIKLNDFKSHQNVTKECGTMSGVKDTILCFWQYMRAPEDNGVGGVSVMRASLLTVLTTFVLCTRLFQ